MCQARNAVIQEFAKQRMHQAKNALSQECAELIIFRKPSAKRKCKEQKREITSISQEKMGSDDLTVRMSRYKIWHKSDANSWDKDAKGPKEDARWPEERIIQAQARCTSSAKKRMHGNLLGENSESRSKKIRVKIQEESQKYDKPRRLPSRSKHMHIKSQENDDLKEPRASPEQTKTSPWCIITD